MLNYIKKIFISFFILFGVFGTLNVSASWSDFINIRYGTNSGGVSSSQEAPEIISGGLPGSKGNFFSFFYRFLEYFIEIVGVLAVFALIFSGIMYVLSGGDDEKTKRAKLWILWSLVAVVLSFSSWGIIAFLNNVTL